MYLQLPFVFVLLAFGCGTKDRRVPQESLLLAHKLLRHAESASIHMLESASELFEFGAIPTFFFQIFRHGGRFKSSAIRIDSTLQAASMQAHEEVFLIASGVFRGDEISARGDADAFAFSVSKDKALRLQAPSCRSGIP